MVDSVSFTVILHMPLYTLTWFSPWRLTGDANTRRKFTSSTSNTRMLTVNQTNFISITYDITLQALTSPCRTIR